MGRLPGGIVDSTRDYIIKHLDHEQRTKLVNAGKKAPERSGELSHSRDPLRSPREGNPAGTGARGMQARGLSPKVRGFFTANTVRGMRYPLRGVAKSAARNIINNPMKEGHFKCTPSTTIGGRTKGILGEFAYKLEGPDDEREPPVSFQVPWIPTSATKKKVGSGTYDGMFAKPTYGEGPTYKPVKYRTFEQTGERMLQQSMYPLIVFPTAMAPA